MVGRDPTPSILLASCRGNVKGQRPYQEGTPCSQCPLGYHCKNSLCGESGWCVWGAWHWGRKVRQGDTHWMVWSLLRPQSSCVGHGRNPQQPQCIQVPKPTWPALPSLHTHFGTLAFQVTNFLPSKQRVEQLGAPQASAGVGVGMCGQMGDQRDQGLRRNGCARNSNPPEVPYKSGSLSVERGRLGQGGGWRGKCQSQETTMRDIFTGEGACVCVCLHSIFGLLTLIMVG